MMESLAQRIRQAHQRQRRRPQYRLVEHFFLRFFDVTSLRSDEDSRTGIAPVLGLVAVPGIIMSLLLFFKYSALARWFSRTFDFDRLAATLPDKYTFIVLSMAATGIVVVLKWETLFPDRQDYYNLAPLPLSTSRIFVAKLVALFGFAAIFATAVNLASSVLFPLIAMESEGTFGTILHFIGAHAASVFAASLFSFLLFLALAGVLMCVVPYSAFRRTAHIVRFLVLAGLLLLFLSTPLLTPWISNVRTGQAEQLSWVAPFWFLGLSEVLHGRATPAFEELSRRALSGLMTIFAVAVAAYALAYRRYYLKTAEQMDVVGSTQSFSNVLWRLLEKVLFLKSMQRGLYWFTVRTLMRSDRHASTVASFLGAGVALAVQSSLLPARDPGGLGVTPSHLAAILTMLFFLIIGLRLCFGVAQEERSNWVFQVAAAEPLPASHEVSRKLMLSLAGLLIASSSFLVLFLGGPWTAAYHALFALLHTLVLVEVALASLRSLPFTCTMIPGRTNPVFAISMFGIGLGVWAHGGATIEYWCLLNPFFLGVYGVIAAGGLFGLTMMRERSKTAEYRQSGSAVVQLRLAD